MNSALRLDKCMILGDMNISTGYICHESKGKEFEPVYNREVWDRVHTVREPSMNEEVCVHSSISIYQITHSFLSDCSYELINYSPHIMLNPNLIQ